MNTLPSRGRICGVDFGTVRVGLAITDPGQTLASPLEIYQRRNPRLDTDFFLKLVQREQIVGFVVGLPLHLSGQPSPSSMAASAFGQWLQELTNLPVVWFDERYSSSLAHDLFAEVKRTRQQKKKLIDKLAAQILLKNFLESDRSNPDLPMGID